MACAGGAVGVKLYGGSITLSSIRPCSIHMFLQVSGGSDNETIAVTARALSFPLGTTTSTKHARTHARHIHGYTVGLSSPVPDTAKRIDFCLISTFFPSTTPKTVPTRRTNTVRGPLLLLVLFGLVIVVLAVVFRLHQPPPPYNMTTDTRTCSYNILTINHRRRYLRHFMKCKI